MTDDLDLVFVRYFSGQLTREDRRLLDRWLAEAPGRPAELERLRQLWLRAEAEPMAVDPEPALARFKARACAEEAKAARAAERSITLPRRRVTPWLAAAASIALVAGLGIWFRWNGHRPAMSTVATASHTFSTPRGQRARLNLPDGTRVLLGPDSRLEVSLDFGAVVREVRLDGLAYFEVAKDSTRPFRVLGGEGTVQVLGTHFSARADSGAAGPLEVVVAEGRVALSSSSARQVLTRGDRGRLSADGTVGVAHGVDLDRSLGWIEGRLDYDNAPLSVVLGDLERWYDVQFVVADSALRRAHLSTTLRDDSLIETLRLLETALGATALVRDKTVVLRLAHQTR